MSETIHGPVPQPQELAFTLGRIDIYVLDQILKGNIDISEKILDAGCGGGRNLIYLMRLGADVYGVDKDPAAIEEINKLTQLLKFDGTDRFRVSDISSLPFEDSNFGTIICSAVLHFATNKDHFQNMVFEMWRVLKPGGILVARLSSTIGISNQVFPLDERPGWYHLPDGTDRFLVNETILMDITQQLKGYLYEPLKTVQVQNMRSMTNWLLQKPL